VNRGTFGGKKRNSMSDARMDKTQAPRKERGVREVTPREKPAAGKRLANLPT